MYHSLIDPTCAKDVLAVANTPRYALKHLRQNDAIAEFGRRNSADSILVALEVKSKSPVSSFDELAETIALLAALASKPRREYAGQLSSISAPHIRWFEQIKDLILVENESTTVVSASALPLRAKRQTWSG